MEKKDIFFEKEWQELFAAREGLPLERVNFFCEEGSVEYAFMYRPIVIGGVTYPYVDIVTPHGFSGPWLSPKQDSPECEKVLAQKFDAYFDSFCKEKKIVAEYVQFSPWMKNHAPFEDLYSMEKRSLIIGMDLSKNDILKEEIHQTRRNIIKRAQSVIEVSFDEEGKTVNTFLELYRNTEEKYDVADYYRMEKDFVVKMFEKLHGRLYIANAFYQGTCVSSHLVLRSGYADCFFLAGNEPSLSRLNANSLLIWKCAEKAKADGKKIYLLGGGEGNMYPFKSSFTKSCYFDYYVGKRVRDVEVYEFLKQANGNVETHFFPAYRDPGNMKYVEWIKED